MKNYSRTALGLLLSISVIASASNANALFGLFEEEKEPLKTEKRAPALNNTNSYNNAPDPNLAFGSMPNTPPLDYYVPTPPNELPQANVNLSAPANNGQMAMPKMPPVTSQAPQPQANPIMNNPLMVTAPQPAPYITAPVNAAPNTYVGPDGFPKLSSIPPVPVAQMPANPDNINPRAESLRDDLRASQSMAGIQQPVLPNADAPRGLAVPPSFNNLPQPTRLPAAAPENTVAAAPEFMPMPPAHNGNMTVAGIQPVLPSGPSVTVHSKRASGAGAPVAIAPMPQFAPEPPVFPTDIPQAAPAPMVEATPIAPEQRTAFAPNPLVQPAPKQTKYVSEASAPVASAFDSPIDGGVSGNGYIANNSYTVGGSGSHAGQHRSRMLPKSRYENYRKHSQQ